MKPITLKKCIHRHCWEKGFNCCLKIFREFVYNLFMRFRLWIGNFSLRWGKCSTSSQLCVYFFLMNCVYCFDSSQRNLRTLIRAIYLYLGNITIASCVILQKLMHGVGCYSPYDSVFWGWPEEDSRKKKTSKKKEKTRRAFFWVQNIFFRVPVVLWFEGREYQRSAINISTLHYIIIILFFSSAILLV